MERMFVTADEVAEQIGMSKSFAYKLIQRLNGELEREGYVTIPGRVDKRYFARRLGFSVDVQDAAPGDGR